MALHNSNIQSYFKPTPRFQGQTPSSPFRPSISPSAVIPSSPSLFPSSPPTSSPRRPGDGFTAAELAASKDPLHTVFNPTREYVQTDIRNLTPGQNAVTFCGRVVGFAVFWAKSKDGEVNADKAMGKKAKGWVGALVSDGTGVVYVKLYFASTAPLLTLGTLLSVWTPLISQSSALMKNPAYVHPLAPLATSIFPGRDAAVNIIIHQAEGTEDECRIPLGLVTKDGKKGQVKGLMTLKQFLEGGHELCDAEDSGISTAIATGAGNSIDPDGGPKLLLAVKSISPLKTITIKGNKNKSPNTPNIGKQIPLVEVLLSDGTALITLKLWREHTSAVDHWDAGKTVLLISKPRAVHELYGSSPLTLALGRLTTVDVDPSPDGSWLEARSFRRWLSAKATADGLVLSVPDGVFSNEQIGEGILFTLADVDEWARADGGGKIDVIFTGWLSLVIMDMRISTQKRAHSLFLAACPHCGHKLRSASSASLPCPNCSRTEDGVTAEGELMKVQLHINPRIIGRCIDETGCVEGKDLLWTSKAWEEMLGRGPAELVRMSVDELQELESRIVGGRYSFRFGWAASCSRLCILSVAV